MGLYYIEHILKPQVWVVYYRTHWNNMGLYYRTNIANNMGLYIVWSHIEIIWVYITEHNEIIWRLYY